MMIDMDDPEHLRRRKLVNKGFTPAAGARQRGPPSERVCDEIIDDVCERGECDFVRDIAAPLPMIMIGDALGFAPEDRDDLLRWSDDMMQRADRLVDPDECSTAPPDAFAGYSEYAAAASSPTGAPSRRDDLMSILVHAEVDGERLDDDSTPARVAAHPHRRRRDDPPRHHRRHVAAAPATPTSAQPLAADPSPHRPPRSRRCCAGSRPIKNMARTVTRDVELGGQPLDEGQKLLLLYPSANRDEAVFDDPFTLRHRPRTPNDHVAFGFGTHFCLGASLARLELEVHVRAAARPACPTSSSPADASPLPPGQLRQRLRADARHASPRPRASSPDRSPEGPRAERPRAARRAAE